MAAGPQAVTSGHATPQSPTTCTVKSSTTSVGEPSPLLSGKPSASGNSAGISVSQPGWAGSEVSVTVGDGAGSTVSSPLLPDSSATGVPMKTAAADDAADGGEHGVAAAHPVTAAADLGGGQGVHGQSLEKLSNRHGRCQAWDAPWSYGSSARRTASAARPRARRALTVPSGAPVSRATSWTGRSAMWWRTSA